MHLPCVYTTLFSANPNSVVMTLPPNTGAFYFYAEPNSFALFNVTATAQDGTTSGPIPVQGQAGAQYFGFYSTFLVPLATIQVDVAPGAGGFAVGEFGIAELLGTTDIDATKECFGPFVPGEAFNCTYTVTNAGQNPAYGVMLTDMWVDIDPFVTSFDWDGDWLCGADLVCTRQSPMPVGAQESIDITFQLPADAHITDPNDDGLFQNCLDYTAFNDAGGDNFLCYGPYAMAPAVTLGAEKVALTLDVAPGGTALFKVTVYNDGPSDVHGVRIRDDLPAGFIGPVMIAPAEARPAGEGLYIPAGGHAEVFVSMRVDPATTPGTFLSNTAGILDLPEEYTITFDPRVASARIRVVDALPEADVQVLSVTPLGQPWVPGSVVETVMIEVRNNGPSPAYGAIVTFALEDSDYHEKGRRMPRPVAGDESAKVAKLRRNES